MADSIKATIEEARLNPQSPFSIVAAMPRHRPPTEEQPAREFVPAPMTATPGPAAAGIAGVGPGKAWARHPVVTPKAPKAKAAPHPQAAPEKTMPTDKTAPVQTAAPAPMPQRAPHSKPVLDLDMLEVELGVQMEQRQATGESKWAVLFDEKLTKPGMSMLVPSIYHGGISAAALKRKKQGKPGVFKLAKAGKAKGVRGIPDGTPVSRVGRVG